MSQPRFRDIESFITNGNYRVNVEWQHLEEMLSSWHVDLDPDYQRGHVWTDEQRTAYVEFILRRGQSSRTILFNCPNWTRGDPGKLELVDGKQRIEAVRSFMNDRIPAFGHLHSEYEDKLVFAGRPDFVFCVNELPTRAEVLQWYLQLNAGGVVHSESEIRKVKALLAKEKKSHGG